VAVGRTVGRGVGLGVGFRVGFGLDGVVTVVAVGRDVADSMGDAVGHDVGVPNVGDRVADVADGTVPDAEGAGDGEVAGAAMHAPSSHARATATVSSATESRRGRTFAMP
jgi:hypothetical protein